MGLLANKIALVLGVTNRFSIAWPIAQALHREGAAIVFSYQGERVERSVRQLAGTLEGSIVAQCDVNEDDQIDALFAAIARDPGGLDVLVHSIAYAPAEALDGAYLNTSREAFRTALETSTFSFTALLQRAAPLMEARGGGSALTLTYLGGERVVSHYNVMGVAKAALDMSVRYLAADLGPKKIRVNAISAGPISTAASRSIKGFLTMANRVAEASALGRSTTTDEVADTAVYLCSDLARGVTGEIIHVDSGYHVMGIV
jgi:enoyl-[acyl-carrier protein] reductase I